jgi:hypothetical protein
MGLWKGLGPNIARNAIINAAELASYDQIKVSLLETGGASCRGQCQCAGGGGWGAEGVAMLEAQGWRPGMRRAVLTCIWQGVW